MAMKRFTLVVAATLVAGLAGCVVPVPFVGGNKPAASTTTQVASGPVSALDQEAVSLVNAFRASQGQAPLAYSGVLGQVALAHSQDMQTSGVMSHEGSDGSAPGKRVNRAGYSWCRVSENVARGQQSLSEAMTSWQGSDGHRRNLLDSQVSEFGVGRAGDYWTMVFAAPGC